jgi:predicted nucleic acid-binding protein
MYLLDTNIWLERLLDQQRSEEVRIFLDKTPSACLFLTDFAFHSIALALLRLGRASVLPQFEKDVFVDNSVFMLRLAPEDSESLLTANDAIRLDFYDAYQSVASVKYDPILVSFDIDLDKTDRGRKTPDELGVWGNWQLPGKPHLPTINQPQGKLPIGI